MKKTVVYMQQKVLLEYDTEEDFKEVLKTLKDNPNCMGVGGGSYRFSKIDTPIKILLSTKQGLISINKKTHTCK